MNVAASFLGAIASAALAVAGTLGHAVQPPARHVGVLNIDGPHGALLPNSRFPLKVSGAAGGVHFALVGPGRLDGDVYVAPAVATPATATLLAGSADAAGSLQIALAPWPRSTDFIAVAAYESGIALHDTKTGALLGVLALDGGVADVAQLADTLVAPSTVSPVLWVVDLAKGTVTSTADVPTGNEVAAFRGAAFVTNRDIAGDGALTRVRDGTVTRIRTGVTAEGLAIDPARDVAYVANVNDGTLAAVDVNAMRVVRRIPAPPRAFGLALDSAAGRIDVVSNVPRTRVQAGGRVESIDLATGRVVARSAAMRFPLGVALDPVRRRLFVSDEAEGTVHVLDARTLRAVHSVLQACRTPWRPAVDLERRRLYVPCAGADALAAFSLDSLRPLPGSPFATAGYPLTATVVRSPRSGGSLKPAALAAVHQAPRDDRQAEEEAGKAHDGQIDAGQVPAVSGLVRVLADSSDHRGRSPLETARIGGSRSPTSTRAAASADHSNAQTLP